MTEMPTYLREFARVLNAIDSALAGVEDLRSLPVPAPEVDDLAMTVFAARAHTVNALGATAQAMHAKGTHE